MRVALLGPNGQLGRDFLRAAENSRVLEVTNIGRDRLDITDSEALKRILADAAFDVLVNCTSYHKTDEVEGNASLAARINSHAVREMAEICAAKKARLVHVSTDYVFGGDESRKIPLAEADSTAPVNVYGASKALGETLACLAHDDVLVLRVASLFGVAGASGKGGNFVETMVRMSAEKPQLRVVADQVMSPSSTADIANAMVRLLSDNAASGTYHVVNSGQASWHEFTTAIVKALGRDTEVVPLASADYPTPARRPRFSVLDNGKLAAAGVAMPPWQDALSRYLYAKRHLA